MSHFFLTGLTVLTLPKEPPNETRRRVHNTAIRKWEHMLKEWRLRCFRPDVPLLRKLIRLWGIPPAMRADAWSILAGAFEVMVPGLYDELHKKPNTHIRQINVDIPRTFGKWATEDKRNALRRVLVAYSNYRPEVGYCQGMNYIVARILEVLLGNEEIAFWLFERMLDPLQSLFTEKMEGYFLTLRMLEAAIGRYTPQLHDLFKRNNIHISTFVQIYLHSLFAYPSISRRFCHLVWDHYILELHTAKRFEFLFRLTMSILRTFEKTIVKLPPVEAVAFLKSGFQEGTKLRHNSKLLRKAWKLSFEDTSILFELPRVSNLRLSINQYEFMKIKFRKLSLETQQPMPVKSEASTNGNFSLKRWHANKNRIGVARAKCVEEDIGVCPIGVKVERRRWSGDYAKLVKSEQRKDTAEYSKLAKPDGSGGSTKPTKKERRKGSLTPTPTREATPEIEKPKPMKGSLRPPTKRDGMPDVEAPDVDKNKPRKGSLTPTATVQTPKIKPPSVISPKLQKKLATKVDCQWDKTSETCSRTLSSTDYCNSDITSVDLKKPVPFFSWRFFGFK